MFFAQCNLTSFFLQIFIFMELAFFTFWALNAIIIELQKHTIWQINRLNLTNLIYFMIYVDENTEKGVKMVIYEGEISWTTLYVSIGENKI